MTCHDGMDAFLFCMNSGERFKRTGMKVMCESFCLLWFFLWFFWVCLFLGFASRCVVVCDEVKVAP